MPFDEFLRLCGVMRSLYDKNTALAFFEKNVGQYYNLGSFDLKKVLSSVRIHSILKIANA